MEPLEALRGTVAAQRALDPVIDVQVRSCRSAGISWADIANAAGVSKATAMTKWKDIDMTAEPVPRDPSEWTIAPGTQLRRRDLQAVYGGNIQSGIAPSRSSDNVLIFTGPAGEHYGYMDSENADRTLTYYGEGQRFDQTMTRGNLAIRDHAANAKALRVFRANGDRTVTYLGEYEYVTHRTVTGKDRTGESRQLIEFTLRPVD